MDFLLYLTPIGREILTGILMKNYQVQENAPICKKQKELFGYTKAPNLVICTDNIKNTVSPVSYYVNETVYHEAVHVIHSCIGGPISIRDAILPTDKLLDVLRSSKITGSPVVYETEAYYLEDKPHMVNRFMKKYCF